MSTLSSVGSRPPVLRDKSFHLAVRMVRLYQYWVSEKNEHILSEQILRAGTSPGAMVREALNGESTADFIHTPGIARKETGETPYWPELLFTTHYLNENEFKSLNEDCEEIMKTLRSSILTKKKNIARKPTTNS